MQIFDCLINSNEAISIFEEWEFCKDYKYSAIFVTNSYDILWAKGKDENLPDNEARESEFMLELGEPFKPVVKQTDDKLYFKFNFAFSAVHPQTQAELLLKYPVLVVVHNHVKILEIRYDSIKSFFVDDSTKTYLDIIREIRDYFRKIYGVQFDALDMGYVKEVVNREKGVNLIAQHMKLATGGRATLEVGNNEAYMLPFLGELKALIAEYQASFEKVPDVYDALRQYIYEKNEMSDFPWIEVVWENEIRTRQIHVKFMFSYNGTDYGVIQHYYNQVLIGKERMDYVIDFIGNHRESSGESIPQS